MLTLLLASGSDDIKSLLSIGAVAIASIARRADLLLDTRA
jgi:hypothetical protein